MGFRFRRTFKVAPGIRLNIGKSSGSLSFGPRGKKLTIGTKGARVTVGAPGTGISYTSKIGGSSSKKSSQSLPLTFFEKLLIPDDEKSFVAGCKKLASGNNVAALQHFSNALQLADGAFMAGVLYLKKGKYADAEKCLITAAQKENELGQSFSKHGMAATLSLPITGEVFAQVGANKQGVLLAMVELYQRQKRWQEAVECLKRLCEMDSKDVVIRLSLADLMFEVYPEREETYQRVLQLADNVGNESPVHAALLLYKAKALRALGSLQEAADMLSALLAQKKNLTIELVQALLHERSSVYEDMKQPARVRKALATE